MRPVRAQKKKNVHKAESQKLLIVLAVATMFAASSAQYYGMGDWGYGYGYPAYGYAAYPTYYSGYYAYPSYYGYNNGYAYILGRNKREQAPVEGAGAFNYPKVDGAFQQPPK